MLAIHWIFTWLPAVASGVMLRVLWADGLLERPVAYLVWFGGALALQIWAVTLSPAWAFALAAQSALGVVLCIKWKLG